VLRFTDQNGISGSFNATTGVLTLSGSSTVANYQAALRSVTFNNASENPATNARAVTFRVNDGTGFGTATRALVVNAVNDNPVAANESYTINNGGTLNVTAGDVSVGSTQNLPFVAMTGNTGEKPMSKVWEHGGNWWAVFSDSNSTNVWRFDGTVWTSVLDLSNRTSVKADVKVVGNVVHVMMLRTSATEFRSVQFVAGSGGSPGTYQFWSTQPNLITLPSMSSLEAVTFDVDSTGKMWVAYQSGGQIKVRHSDTPYTTWSAEIVLDSNVGSDDIASIVALPNGQIGLFWSNQDTDLFGFRIHVDGTDPNTWLADELPGDELAGGQNQNLSDDHMNMAVKADGTIYVAIKTSFNSQNYPRMMLFIRRPNGVWETYDIDQDRTGTRPIVQLNSADGRLLYFYRNTDSNGPIVYRSITDNGNSITIGAETIVMNGDSIVNADDISNVSGSKASFSDDLVVIGSASGRMVSARLVYRFGVLANDSDIDGDNLQTQLVSGPSHGTLTLNPNGTFTYTHNGVSGSIDSFTYRAIDATGQSNIATVTITIDGAPNAPPNGVTNSYTLAEGGTLNANDSDGSIAGTNDDIVLLNDSDPEGQSLTAVLISNPLHGTLTLNSNGTFTYTHDGSENLTDSFTYRPHDGVQLGNLTTVNLTITQVNDAPVGIAESYSVGQGGTLVANDAAGTVGDANDNGVLVNDTDAEGNTLNAVLVSLPAHGSLTLNSDGTFTYVHNGIGVAADSFTYRPNDGSTDGNLVTVTINVLNTPPVGVNDSYTVAEGGTLDANDATGTIGGANNDGVLVNDTDAELNPLTAVLVTNPAHGTLTFNSNGTFTYVHNGGEATSDSFTYRPNDGAPGNLTTVNLTITPINDAPVGVNESYSISTGGTIDANDATGTVGGANDNGVLANDTDDDGNPLTAVLVTGTTHGSLTLNTDGTFTYVHGGVGNTTDSFTYRPNDGTTDGNLVTVTINIQNVPPVGVNDSYTVAEGGTLDANDATGTVGSTNDNSVLANDTDWNQTQSRRPGDEPGSWYAHTQSERHIHLRA
jgi:VCBS repeat-containing protein